MIDIEKKSSVIIGAKLNGFIVSFIILNYVVDNSQRKRWCMIRYLRFTGDNEIDRYILKRMLSMIKKVSFDRETYNIGLPSYIMDKERYMTEELKKMMIQSDFCSCNSDTLINNERISLFIKLK